jgi:TPR repeat protein
MKIRLLLLSILLISSPHLAAGMFDQLIQEGVNAVGKKAKKGISNIGKTDFEKGKAANDEGDYKTALGYLLPLAEKGDMLAQYEVSNVYMNLKDATEMFKWSKLSADQGHLDAQFFVGESYRSGLGVPIDSKAAFKSYSLAVEGGHAPGWAPVNHYKLASAFHMGYALLTGTGVKQDDINGYMWTTMAANEGWDPEQTQQNLEVAKSRMSPPQITKAIELAKECHKVKANWFKECGMDPAEAAQFAKQLVGLEKAHAAKEKELDLKKFYEAYFLVRACNDLDTKYINNSQLKKTKKAIRSLDDQAKKQGVDTDKVYKDAETNPSESTNNSLAMVKTIKLLGGANFNPQLRTMCMGQSNILILLAEGDKAKKQKGKKDF